MGKIENKDYNCLKCLLKHTKMCKKCTTVNAPSGKTSKPTLYIEEIPKFELTEPQNIYSTRRFMNIKQGIIEKIQQNQDIPLSWMKEYYSYIVVDEEKSNVQT